MGGQPVSCGFSLRTIIEGLYFEVIMPKLTWPEISEISHALKNERVVICGAILGLKKADKRIKRIVTRLDRMILKHEDDNV